MTQPDDSGTNLVALSILSTLALFTCLEVAAIWTAGGVFEYPLDDVYIHLAMAENIAMGGYGVNAGEYASASSSPLYPFLLMPLISPEFQRFLPLIWNVAGLIASTWLWARILVEAGFAEPRFRVAGLALAALGPAAFLSVTTAFLGMEHVLHATASLAILLGLFRYLREESGKVLLFVGIFLAPLFRLEGVAFSLLAAGVLFATGARRLGLLALLLAVLPLLGFMGFLVILGLDPLPGSVLAKLADGGGQGLNPVSAVLTKLKINLVAQGGWILAITPFAVLLMGGRNQMSGNAKQRWLALAVFLAGFAHLAAAQMGWMNRYEHYILAVVCGGFVIFVPHATARFSPLWANGVAVLPFVALLVTYLPDIPEIMVVNPRAIDAQQAQMARFAQDHLKAPVAVNDLGRVGWNNPHYVLDLWGLASPTARDFRLNGAEPGWAAPMARAQNVPVAMIYDKWLADAAGEDWVRVGELSLTKARGFLGSANVAFYATGPEHVAGLQTALKGWVPTLPQTASFTYAEGFE